MSITRHHNEWLTLVPNSGPFLSLPVLTQAFPQGLDAHDADHARRLRMACEEWDDNQSSARPDLAIHRAWVKLVLTETLGFEEVLAEGQAIPQTLKSEIAEYGETLRPDWIINDPATKKARLLVQTYPRWQPLTKPVQSSRWKTSPDTRMMQLLHDTGIRLGLVTNGDHWMLVNAPKNETSGYVTWYANLWLEEPLTLRAFRTLLCADRFFSVPENETIEALLDRSAADQQEVTDQLGYQVRKAVEVLIQALDKSDQDHGRKLLADVDEKVLYEAALTVMMRLVFLFCAEERELLLLGDDLYDKNYAVSTLREQLEVAKSEHTEEILGLRYDAWLRLLTTFRAVYAGTRHDRLKLPAYGGGLFHPDRFPFLEGRKLGTCWKDTEAMPLPVSNRTVLHLLEALQVLQVRLPGGGAAEARTLSFRSLDIEQIGHVYEGLLDHTAKRAREPVLGLQGTRDREPEIPLAELEKLFAKGEKELLKYLKDETGRSESTLKKGLNAEVEDQLASRFRTTCQDSVLWKRVQKFAGLIRLDTTGYPVVITPGSVFVTAGTDRRSSGTHYTPKSLTEPIVRYTLEPLVYFGPADGLSKEQWTLRSAKELLDLKICDMACGSGAFLVQACRYLSARLLEAWDDVQRANPGTVRITPEGRPSTGQLGEMLIPDDSDERQTYALRIVAQRCLYGVDRNRLAVEMAKVSLWLLTLAKDRPFEFLDHAIRCGDSLVGIHNLDQLRKFNLDGKGEDNTLFLQFLDPRIKEAIELRRKLETMQANSVEDVQAQEQLMREANDKMERLKCAADMLVGAEFLRWDQHELIEEELRDEERDDEDRDRPGPSWLKAKKATEQFRRAARTHAAIETAVHFDDSDLDTFQFICQTWLNDQLTFHWPLEFPEAFHERGGFDAFVMNPPFMGGLKLETAFGSNWRDYVVEQIADGSRGKRGTADLCAYFLLRVSHCLAEKACAGIVTTSSVSEGDTRQIGLEHLLNPCYSLVRAIPAREWPGSASLRVAILWFFKSIWHGTRYLGEMPTSGISPALVEESVTIGRPERLQSSKNRAFMGATVSGIGFILSAKDATTILQNEAKAKEVIFPYISGEDVNTRPDCSPSRQIINFFDWPYDRAELYPVSLNWLRTYVKPERDKLMGRNPIGTRRATFWWRYAQDANNMFRVIDGYKKVLVKSGVSKHHAFAFLQTGFIPAHTVFVFAFQDYGSFAVLQSSLHEVWSAENCSSLGGTLRYTPMSCFETYVFPNAPSSVDNRGQQLHEFRRGLMLAKNEGLTKTYNHFHDPDEAAADIQKLRHFHVEMDNAVAAAYGWTDFDLGHGFHKTKQGTRYTISEPARREILARLLKLNHERYAEEVAKGMHDKKKAKGTKKAKKVETADTGGTLFGEDAAS
jgi:hypothetical protein